MAKHKQSTWDFGSTYEMNFSQLRKTLFLFIVLASNLYGQNAGTSDIIEGITFLGLKNTKKAYLENILSSKIYEKSNLTQINNDLQTLKNLPSIADAKFELDTTQSGINLRYQIQERRTALPIINFGGIRNNIWFSIGGIENNFRGYGDLALAYYQNNNGRHSGQIYFKKPRIINSDWGYSFTLNKWSSNEPVFFDSATVEYVYNNNGLGATLIRNFGLDYQIEIGGTYFQETYEKIISSDQIELPGPNGFSINKALFKLELRQKLLDYHLFYLDGVETIVTYQSVFNLDQSDIFNSIQLQTRYFLRPKEQLNIAMRLKLGLSTNNDSPFAPFVADSHVNIRGIGNRIDRGTAQLIFNLEGRYTILHKNHLSSQLVAFADTGTWRNPGGVLSDIWDPDQFRQFVGFGIRINYQKVFGATLRIDYGIDIFDKEQRGIVIGLGQYY